MPAPVLVAGGSGRLGREVVRRLTAQGLPVRILTRDPTRVASPRDRPVEIVSGDVTDPSSLDQAVAGAATVVSAISGFPGAGGSSPKSVDW